MSTYFCYHLDIYVYLTEVAVDLHTDLDLHLLSVVALNSVMEQAVSSVKLT